MACACGWDTMKELKELRVTSMNVSVISLYFLHPTATESTHFLSAHLFLIPHSLNIWWASLRLVLMACKTSRKTPEGKDKTKNNPNNLQTTFLSKFCMSITWELLQTNTHYYSYLEGNKQMRKPVEMHPERTSLNSSQTTCTFLREKNKTRNKKRKTKLQTNKPQ